MGQSTWDDRLIKIVRYRTIYKLFYQRLLVAYVIT